MQGTTAKPCYDIRTFAQPPPIPLLLAADMLLGLRPLPAPVRAVTQRLFSAAVDEVAPEVREKITELIRRQRQKGTPAQWPYLRKRFNVSLEVAKQIEAQAVAAAKRSSPVSARVTRLADDAYDAAHGQRDWSAVARNAGLPLVECLGHFSAELSKHPVQPRPTLDDWSTKDILAVRELLHELPQALYHNAWNLAGAYINADPSDCRDVFGLPDRRSPAPKVVAALKRHRDNGMLYHQMHERFPIHSSRVGLAALFRRQSRKKAMRGDRTWDDALSPADHECIRQTVREHYRPGGHWAVVRRLIRELPHIDPQKIDGATRYMLHRERSAVRSNIDRLAKLVSTHGDDWDRIGQEMGTAPSIAKAVWIRQTAEKATSANDAVAPGNPNKDSDGKTRRLAALSLCGWPVGCPSCHSKLCQYALQLFVVSPDSARDPPRKWTDEEYSELLQLVADYGDEPVDWAAVGEVLGRSMDSCLSKYHGCQRSPPTDPKRVFADAIDTVVQKQLACGSGVDWEKASQAVGLNVRRCLELCRVDGGKGRWVYHPDTVSWTPAKRMEAFIADNYPAPAVPNFRAVSNYLWIDMDDCIRMFDVLRGKIVWTDELKAWAVEMRESGMTYPMITRKLTPHPLSPSTIRRLICGYKTPYAPASSELRERVDDFLDNNAKRCTFRELFKLAKVHFEGPEKHSAVAYMRTRTACHKAYAARLEKVDVAAAYEQVASKKVTCRDMAGQLGVPPDTLRRRLQNHETKMHSGTWTDAETVQLMEFLDKTSPPHSWIRFSKLIGTKSVQQCRNKYNNLQMAGRISQVKV